MRQGLAGWLVAVESTFDFVGMPIPVFRVGPPQRPAIKHDDGHLGRFPRRQATAADRVELTKWIGRLELGEAIQGVPFLPKNDLPDALAAYRHFLFGKGQDRTFSYERYVQNDPSGKVTVSNAVVQAKLAAEALFAGRRSRADQWTFNMVSSAIPCGADSEESPWVELYPYPETENWQKAIGAHFLWVSAQVTATGTGLHPTLTMHISVHAEDRYNFNPGDSDISTGIPDEANGKFELAGLGHQYTNYSTLTRMLRWTAMSPEILAGIIRGKPGRQRKPNDNRRLRNRL
jgi:hypothetical protein